MTRRMLRGVAAGLLLLLLLVGVPVVLILLAGWPLPSKMPDWGHVSTMVRQADIPADNVIKVIACVVWVAWLQLAWAVVWELAVNVPRTVQGRRHREAPLVAAPVAGGVGRLFAAILAIGVLTTSTGSVAVAKAPLPGGLPSTFAGAAAAVVVDSPTAAVSTSVASTDLPVWVTSSTDTLWSISRERHR